MLVIRRLSFPADPGLGMGHPGRSGHFLRHDGLANGGEGDARELQMLDCKWDADDGDKTGNCRGQMANCQPQACEDKPDDIAQHAETTGTHILLMSEQFPANRLFAKWKERKLANNKTGPSPGDTDHGDISEQAK